MISIIIALILLLVHLYIYFKINKLTENNNFDCDKCEIVEQFCVFLNETLTKLEDGKVDDVKTDIKNVLTMMENSENEE